MFDADVVNCISQAMTSLYKVIDRIALCNAPVLIVGPTGSGKEIIANRIHCAGKNYNAPLIDVNCGSIPENLMESELFGHEKGSFTGATVKHKGYFNLVGDGTLFLDEIGELTLPQQVKLLRVLETRKFRPVGSESNLEFNGKIITATNKDLEQLVAEKKFREDLYYRLNVFKLDVPALNERMEDIPILIQHFASKQREDLIFSKEAMAEIIVADWPGNVRQLKNFVERISYLSEKSIIPAATVRLFLSKQSDTDDENLKTITEKIMGLHVKNKLTTVEYHIIQRSLDDSNGNKSAAAKILGVHRKTVERCVKAFDIDAHEIFILSASGKKHQDLSEYIPALREYEKSINLAEKYSCSVRFESLKFEILLKQCVCLRNLNGYNSADVIKKHDEALALGKKLSKADKLPPIYFGIWAKHLMNMELAKALELAEKYLNESRSLENPSLISQAYITIANTKFWMGEFEDVHKNLSGFIKFYVSNDEIFSNYGYDPFVLYLFLFSLASFHLGDFRGSKKTLAQLHRYAETIEHPYSTAIALHASTWITFLMGDYKKSHSYCTRLIEMASNAQFTFYTGIGMVFKGYYNTAFGGEPADGIDLIKEGFAMASNGSGLLFHSLYAIILGRVHIMDNNIPEALGSIQKAIRIADDNKELCYISELLSVRGELYRLMGDAEKAENDLRAAICLAAQLKSIPAELNACISLAIILSDAERGGEAKKILGQILAKIPKANSAYKSVGTAKIQHCALKMVQRANGAKK